VGAVLGVGEAPDVGGETARGEGDAQVVERRAAAEDQVPTVRVGGHEVALRVGVQMHLITADLPAPRLAVVHRRRAKGVPDGVCEWPR
jgi:hypothetical protein